MDEVKRMVVSAEGVVEALARINSFIEEQRSSNDLKLGILKEILNELQALNSIVFEMRADTRKVMDEGKVVTKAIFDTRTFFGGYKKMIRTSFGAALVYLSGLGRSPPGVHKFQDKHTKPARRTVVRVEDKPLTATIGETVEEKDARR